MALAGDIAENLADKISRADDSDFIDIIIQLKSDNNSINLNKELAANYTTNADRHRAGINHLKRNASRIQFDLLAYLSEARAKGSISDFKGHWLVNIISAKASAAEIKRLSLRKDVLAIYQKPEPIGIIDSTAIFQPIIGKITAVESNLQMIGADQAWSQNLTGEGSIVCSFDTGVEGNHPALNEKWKGLDGNSSAAWYDPFGRETIPHTFPEVDDGENHGTHVMGIMVGHNGTDTIGVAPGAKWISAAVIDLPYVSIIEAFEWAADPDGNPNTYDDVPDVINHSWGFRNSIVGCNDYVFDLIDNTEALGIVNIFAAGNRGINTMSISNPANRANDNLDCFAVGAYDRAHETRLASSSRGPSDCDEVSIKPNVVAPGDDVRSSFGMDYGLLSGTSIAAPHVSGAVAILRQHAPNSTPDQIKEALLMTCTPLPEAGSPPNYEYGWGMINIPAAIAYLTPEFETDLVINSFGDFQANPGETVQDYITTKNRGQTVDNVYAEVISAESGVTVLSGNLNFGTVAFEGTAQSDIPFEASLDQSVSPGDILTVDMALYSDGGYSKNVTLFIRVGESQVLGLPSFYTLNNGLISFTISNFGQYGFGSGSFFPLGYDGFSFDGGGNELFESAFMIGVGIDSISDGARNFTAEPDNDFLVSFGGEMQISIPGALADIETTSGFTDLFAENPLGLNITQRSFCWNSSPDNDFIIFEYEMENQSGTTLNAIYAGLFFDWDLISYSVNSGAYSETENLGYMYHSGDAEPNTYRGITVVNQEGVAAFKLRANSISTYLTWEEDEKFTSIADGVIQAFPDFNKDLSLVIATGPFNLESGQSDTAVFAIVAAGDLSGVQSAAGRAVDKYNLITDIELTDSNIPEKFELSQNYPNPFNPATFIEFSLEKRGFATLSIFNIIGQKVAEPVHQELPAGQYRTEWNGRDFDGQILASGVYFYMLTADGKSQSKKMVILK
jgi:subtilisin family serine protease